MSDVKIGGVVVGHVADERLDPNTYAAIVRLAMNDDIKIPEDSSASITSDGLLGGDYVAVSPGGSNTMLAPGPILRGDAVGDQYRGSARQVHFLHGQQFRQRHARRGNQNARAVRR